MGNMVRSALTCHNMSMCTPNRREHRIPVVEATVILEVGDLVCFFPTISAIFLQPLFSKDKPCCCFTEDTAKRPYID